MWVSKKRLHLDLRVNDYLKNNLYSIQKNIFGWISVTEQTSLPIYCFSSDNKYKRNKWRKWSDQFLTLFQISSYIAEQRNLCRFGTIWGQVNDDNIVVNYPFNIDLQYKQCLYVNFVFFWHNLVYIKMLLIIILHVKRFLGLCMCQILQFCLHFTANIIFIFSIHWIV